MRCVFVLMLCVCLAFNVFVCFACEFLCDGVWFALVCVYCCVFLCVCVFVCDVLCDVV